MSKRIIKMAITGALIVAIIFVGYRWWHKGNSIKKTMAKNMSVAEVTKGDLEVILKGAGTLSPMEQETINLKVDGTVKKVYFDEGDIVKKGDLLFELEDNDLNIGLKKSQLALAQQQLNFKDTEEQREKTIIYAPDSGVVKSVNGKSGDLVNTNNILATIVDQNKTQVYAPFNSSQFEKLKLGQKAEVLFLDSIYTVEGTVSKLETVGVPTSSGAIYYYATIDMEGNYYIEGKDTRVQVHIMTDSGKQQALEEVVLKPQEVVEVKPEMSSKIKDIYIEEGDVVEKGQKLFSLDGEDIDMSIEKQSLSLQQAKLDLESKLKQRENLFIYSPIDGTIIEQNVREGDLIRPSTSSSSSEPAVVIVNYSKMKIVLPIDELDINKVEIGIPVKITAEAVPDKIFQGKVEKIAEQGQSQNNVATFDVTITTDKVEELKAGMTVDVELVADSKQDVLMLPITAIQYQNGKSYVIPIRGENFKKQNELNNNRTASNSMIEVKTGITNGEYIEILSGLKEGDRVMVSSNSSDDSSSSRRPDVQMNPMGPMPMRDRQDRG